MLLFKLGLDSHLHIYDPSHQTFKYIGLNMIQEKYQQYINQCLFMVSQHKILGLAELLKNLS